nr:hypothetical protein [Bacteroidaceae bacterium]
PWGWNYSLRNMFVRAGIDPQRLPSDDNLFVYRYLSQRKIVNTFLDVMAGQPGFCGVSLKAEKAADCAQYFEKQKNAGGVVFKEPWSSSGKGLLWCRSAFTEKDLNWCQRVIENEGYVTMSPIYNKVQDFAMEYFIDENDESKVSFLGYSLFSTDKNGFYKSNELLSNQEIKDYLLTYVSEETLNKALQTIGNMLWQFHYQGCVGVDMMICEEEGKMCIHPCVEINYRATMGYLARILKDDFLTEDAHGKFFIKHFSTHDELVSFVEENKQKAPLDIQNRRLRSGFLPLVPVRPDSMNIAYLDVY